MRLAKLGNIFEVKEHTGARAALTQIKSKAPSRKRESLNPCVGDQLRNSFEMPLRKTEFKRDVPAFSVPSFSQPAAEVRQIFGGVAGRPTAKIADHRHTSLLRTSHERPRNSRDAEQRDEVAALHLMEPPLPLAKGRA
jgi:hypothetical protein